MYSTIYWDLGGGDTQLGSNKAIRRLVVLQLKVLPLLHRDNSVIANVSTGSNCRRNHLGSRRYGYPRFSPRPLHSHIPDTVFPYHMLCGP